MQQVYEQKVVIPGEMTDQWGRLRPSDLLRLCQQIAGAHCDTFGFNEQFMQQRNLLWAIVRTRIEISQTPTAGQTILLKTWPMPTTRVSFPRACVAYAEDGRLLFSCHSLWILMDAQSRSMVLPGKSDIQVSGVCLEDAPAAPGSLAPLDAPCQHLRQVTAEDLDQNGHMNNARYLDWAEDVLTPDFHGQHRLKNATLCYHNEALEGQTLQLAKAHGAQEQLLLDICREDPAGKQQRIFSAALEYEPVVM